MADEYHIQESLIYPWKEGIYRSLCSFLMLILELRD